MYVSLNSKIHPCLRGIKLVYSESITNTKHVFILFGMEEVLMQILETVFQNLMYYTSNCIIPILLHVFSALFDILRFPRGKLKH